MTTNYGPFRVAVWMCGTVLSVCAVPQDQKIKNQKKGTSKTSALGTIPDDAFTLILV